MSAIIANNLVKIYSSKQNSKLALDNINLEVPRGSFFGLLGVNGAGKSTFINILAGLVNKTSGNISICGHDIDTDTRNARYKIGVVPQELVLDPFFPPKEVLKNTAGYYGIKKSDQLIKDVLEAVGLQDKANSPARSLSGGMRRRLLVAKAMIHNPDVLILDEPTAGVDVELREQLWEYIVKLNKAGTTIILTTHYLEEAQELCDNIAILNKGKIIANDSKKNILQILDTKRIIITTKNKISKDILTNLGEDFTLINDNQLQILFSKVKNKLNYVFEKLQQTKVNITDISTCEADLEDIFKHLVK